MKVVQNIQNKCRGIVLVTTLATVLVLGIIVASYLTLSNQVSKSVARSQAWNQTIPVLESGIEEALTQLYYAGTNSWLLTSNSWTYGLDGLYHKKRVFADGTFFNVSIQPASNPVIVSTGYVALASASSATVTNYLSRRVKVIAQKVAATPGGLNAKGSINFTGGGFLDSFDSSDPSYSSNGLYVPSLHKDNGQALTDSGAAGAINTGTGKIYGSATTGPGGTVLGTVGNIGWDASSSGVESGHSANNANVQFNDVAAPFVYGTGATPTLGTYLTTNFTYVVGSGNYNMPTLSIQGGQMMAVTGNAVLYVNGTLTVGGSGYIYIAPGASLTMYVNGDSTISGTGVVNGSQNAAQCTIFGMPGCTTFTYSGSSGYIGTVYAPDAAFTYSGSASASGSFTASTILLSGGAGVHYDEALANAGKGWVVMSWNEF